MNRPLRRAAVVLWSGFLVAAALKLAVSAFVDPEAVHGLLGSLLQLSTTAVHSLAFFVFWVAAAAGAALCLFLDGGADQIKSTAGYSLLSNGFNKLRR